ncbi:MAG: methyltransferase domain-containing protein [Spirochaetia bacterium]
MTLPFGAERFDLVTSTILFHHWSDQEKGLREVSRVLRKPGRFILADLADLPWWLAWHRNDGQFLSCNDRLEALSGAGLAVGSSYRHFLGVVRVTVSRR